MRTRLKFSVSYCPILLRFVTVLFVRNSFSSALSILRKLVALWTTLSLLKNMRFTLWERPFEVTLLSCLITITEPHCQSGVTSPSCAGGAGFKYQPGDACPHWDLHGYLKSRKTNVVMIIQVMPWPLPSTYFPIQH